MSNNMNYYLLALGWWNLIGSLMMIGFFNEGFGKKVLNEWTKIFVTEFRLDYWSKFWLAWTIGLNIFFGAINIFVSGCDFLQLKQFIIYFDLFAYVSFVGLTFWGIKAKHCGTGIYSVFVIFSIWIVWGVDALLQG